jgi:hypothetical protein
MPVLNIEKFSICPATGILCAMEFDPRRTIGQGAGPGSVHRDFMSRRRRCPDRQNISLFRSTSRCTAETHENSVENMKETKDGPQTTCFELANSLVRGSHVDALACAEG